MLNREKAANALMLALPLVMAVFIGLPIALLHPPVFSISWGGTAIFLVGFLLFLLSELSIIGKGAFSRHGYSNMSPIMKRCYDLSYLLMFCGMAVSLAALVRATR